MNDSSHNPIDQFFEKIIGWIFMGVMYIYLLPLIVYEKLCEIKEKQK